MTNDTFLSVQDLMAKVMGDVREVAKTRTNPEQHFTFRGVDEVVNAVSPALRRHGVVVLPHLDDIQYVPITTSKGKIMMSARVIVTFSFVGPRGDQLKATVPGEAFDSGDKATAKAMSVAFRTALLQALALPTDDIDPDAETYERAAPVSGAVHGESTVANEGMAVTASPSEPRDAQAALGEAASPSSSAAGKPVDPEAPAGEGARPAGGGASTPAGASTNYLSKDDQALLTVQFGSKVAALNAYKAKFGSHITRLADITYEQRDDYEAANA